MRTQTIITIFTILIAALVVGCAPATVQQYNVTMHDAEINETQKDNNRTIDMMRFTLKNNENFDLNCSIITEISNKTNLTSTRSEAGLIEGASAKRITLKIEMLNGEAELNLKPECARV
jgi:hypothetical protein